MTTSPSTDSIAQTEPRDGLIPNPCRCIEIMNKAAEEAGHEAMVDTALVWSGRLDAKQIRIRIRFSKMDSRNRKRLPILIAQFCPLCGSRYLPDVDSEAAS